MVARRRDALVELRPALGERLDLVGRVLADLVGHLALGALVEPPCQVQLLEGAGHRTAQRPVARGPAVGLRCRPRPLATARDAIVEPCGEARLVVDVAAGADAVVGRLARTTAGDPERLRLAGDVDEGLGEGVLEGCDRHQRVGGDRREVDGLGDVGAVLRGERPPVAVLPLRYPVPPDRGVLAEGPRPQRGVEPVEDELGVELAELVDEGDACAGGDDLAPAAEQLELREDRVGGGRPQRRRDEHPHVVLGVVDDRGGQGQGGEPLGAHTATSSFAKASR